MRVPMKVDYGVRALVDLAQRYGDGSVQTVEMRTARAYRSRTWSICSPPSASSGSSAAARAAGGHVLAKSPTR